jgi:CRP-like cAMP-binding protein
MFILSEILDLVSDENKQLLIDLLKNAPQYITDHSVIKNLLPDQTLIMADQKADKVYLHISGTLQGVDTQKPDVIYSFVELKPINIIGEFEAFSNRRNYLINIIAKTNATLLSIDVKDFLSWMKCDVDALNIICRYLAFKLSDELKTNREYLFLNSYDRLLLYLYHSINKKQGKRLITIYKTQNEIADQIGFSGKTINRTIAKLVADGLITSGRNTIKITPEQYLMLKEKLEERRLI